MSREYPKSVALDERKFLEWLNTKPRDEEYRFRANKTCAVAQYLKFRHPGEGVSANVEYASVWDWEGRFTHRYDIPPVVQRAFGKITGAKRGRPITFGETADSLSELLMADA